MAGPSWLVDSKRIATKIKSASGKCDPKRVNWKSNPSRACPKCNHIIDNGDVTQEWPGLPCGVKFDPSDQEIICHLLAKVGNGNLKTHPFIEEFIPTVNEEDGICYTHPQNLPGVKQDGSVSHFFHRAIKAYNTGTRKRRKIHGDDLGDVRWHKTGRTKPMILDGKQMGCKKIMVLYMSTVKSGKPEKTNWVMHQYHLGTGEDENDGDFVLSKIFYQQLAKHCDKVEQDLSCDTTEAIITKVDPVTPKSATPEPPRIERWQSDVDPGQECEGYCVTGTSAKDPVMRHFDEAPVTRHFDEVPVEQVPVEQVLGDSHNHAAEDQKNHMVGDRDDIVEDPNLWAGESQCPLDSQQFGSQCSLNSQQLAEGLALFEDLLRSQPSCGEGDSEEKKNRLRLSDHSRFGVEVPKHDQENCQNLGPLDLPNSSGRRMLKPYASDYIQGAEYPKQDLEGSQDMSRIDLSMIELDTPPDFRLSQLDFESEDSFFGCAGTKLSD